MVPKPRLLCYVHVQAKVYMHVHEHVHVISGSKWLYDGSGVTPGKASPHSIQLTH